MMEAGTLPQQASPRRLGRMRSNSRRGLVQGRSATDTPMDKKRILSVWRPAVGIVFVGIGITVLINLTRCSGECFELIGGERINGRSMNLRQSLRTLNRSKEYAPKIYL